MRSRYKHGQWLANCDRCGMTYHNTQMRSEWNGLMVCSGPGTNHCWEPRHPQEFVKGRADRQTVPWTRPDDDGIDVSVGSGNEVSRDDL